MQSIYAIKTTDGKTNYVGASSKKAALSKISVRYPLKAQIIEAKKCSEA